MDRRETLLEKGKQILLRATPELCEIVYQLVEEEGMTRKEIGREWEVAPSTVANWHGLWSKRLSNPVGVQQLDPHRPFTRQEKVSAYGSGSYGTPGGGSTSFGSTGRPEPTESADLVKTAIVHSWRQANAHLKDIQTRIVNCQDMSGLEILWTETGERLDDIHRSIVNGPLDLDAELRSMS